jgi:hypothetical protein
MLFIVYPDGRRTNYETVPAAWDDWQRIESDYTPAVLATVREDGTVEPIARSGLGLCAARELAGGVA